MIVSKIVDEYVNRPDSRFLVEDMRNVVELAQSVRRGEPEQEEEVYD